MFSFTLRSFPRLDFIFFNIICSAVKTLEQIAWEHHKVFITGRPPGQAVRDFTGRAELSLGQGRAQDDP